MSSARFEFALRQLDSSQWRRFEKLASAFLAAEFKSLRTVANASGDRGRDAELFASEGESSVLIQYSVAADWASKIRVTANRLRQEFPQARVLIYLTNHEIGARADDLKTELRREHEMLLDVRDRNWFLERAGLGGDREALAEAFAAEVADPILTGRGLLEQKSPVLTDLEARAAHVFLALQWEDDTREKGLTRLCFEGLARSALRDTSSEHRISRAEVKRRIRALVPSHVLDDVEKHVDSALRRLTKRSIRHWTKEDEFCLANDERQRQLERLAEFEERELELRDAVMEAARENVNALGLAAEKVAAIGERARRVVEAVLWARGEEFAQAVTSESLSGVGVSELRDRVLSDLTEHPDSQGVGSDLIHIVELTVRDLLLSASEPVGRHLRAVADAYTLLAFLRETPDVQGAMRKIFASGEVWLDTSIALPVLAEELLDSGRRQYTAMLKAASAAGLRLYITRGVLEELERHINRALTCVRFTEWRGATPFLLHVFLLSGRALGAFAGWIDQFRGPERPEDDIAEYLKETLGVEVRDLLEWEAAPDELRHAVQELWHEAHERRRQQAVFNADMISTNRLVLHDVENYVGVIQRRSGEVRSTLGYSAWWLTLDHFAFNLGAMLSTRLQDRAPSSPVMSPDFLVNYLALGPRRDAVAREAHEILPLALDQQIVEFAPKELFDLADRLRKESGDVPERVVRRRVRDSLDSARRRQGRKAIGGVRGMEKELADAIDESA